MRTAFPPSAAAKPPQPAPEGTRFAPRWQSASAVPTLQRAEAADVPAGRVLEEDALDRVHTQKPSTWSMVGSTSAGIARSLQDGLPLPARPAAARRRLPPCRSTSAPSPATTPRRCLSAGRPAAGQVHRRDVPGERSAQVNGERACSATRATTAAAPCRSRPRAWAAPQRASSSRSSIQLGVKRILRVGTCGGLQADLAIGDLIVASRPYRPTRRRRT